MRSLILCVAPHVPGTTERHPEKNLDIHSDVLENAEFAPDVNALKSLVLEHQEESSYDVIWAQDCALDMLFTPDSDPKRDVWGLIWTLLKPGGVFTIRGLQKYIGVTHELQDFSHVVREVNSIFVLIAFRMNAHVFRKVTSMVRVNPDTLSPTSLDLPGEVTTPEDLNAAMEGYKPLSDLFNLNPDKEVCEIAQHRGSASWMKPPVLLGGGAEGQVFHYPEWRTDVAVKRIITDHLFIPGATEPLIPKPSKSAHSSPIYWVEQGFLEVLSSSLISELSTGSGHNGFSLHIPRFTGFFTCLHDETQMNESGGVQAGPKYEIYVITELMQGSLEDALNAATSGRRPEDLLIAKSLIWQALYSLVSINALQWQHHDASPRNFLVSNVKRNELFLDMEIGKASRWVHKLELGGKRYEWSLKNFLKVVKIADYGILTHEDDPIIESDQKYGDAYRIDGKMKGAFDVNYFMTTLPGSLRKANPVLFEPLFKEWYALMGVPKGLTPHNVLTTFQNLGKFETWPESVTEVINYAFRSKPKYDNWNPISLLNSKFFSDVVK